MDVCIACPPRFMYLGFKNIHSLSNAILLRDAEVCMIFFWKTAEQLGLPFLPPYLGPDKDFRRGVNFAVAGATALDLSFLEERKIFNNCTENSLGIQLEWFKQLLPSLCSNPSDCNGFLGTSLFVVGEIGGNDLNYAFFEKHSLDEIQTFVPLVINTIASAINTVIEYGARTILVPGNLPIGCLPVYLILLKSPDEEDYDPRTGCLRYLNEFSENYNHLLKRKLDGLRALHPNATILYADYYNAAMPMYVSPQKYEGWDDKKQNPFFVAGFSNGALMACCGGGGPHNRNISAVCGSGLEQVCSDPSTYVSWDGIHLTEAAYRLMADRLMEGLHFTPPITNPST
ncbi:hypothetical protein ACLOJK_010471 [Asimina triloba]